VAAISYSIAAGQPLESVTTGTNAPSAGSGTIEIRIDQTAAAITDAAGNRILKKGEIQQMIRTLEEYLIRDTNVFE
jgi:hypothetical protein